MHSPSITAQPSSIVSATHHTTSNNSVEAFSLLSRQSDLHTTQHQTSSTHNPMRMTTTNVFPTSNNMVLGSTTNHSTMSNNNFFLQSSSNVPSNNGQQSMITFTNRQDMMVISSSPLSNSSNPFSATSSQSSPSIQPLANDQVNQNMYNNDQAPSFITSTVPMSTVIQPNNNTTSSSTTSLSTVNNVNNTMNSTNSSIRFVTVTNNAGRYEGEVNPKNERHGKGTMYFAGGGFYKGYWANDKMEGKGEYSWGDGNHYLGMFKDGKQNGVGVYEWPSGGKYIGHWKDDKMHGFGTYKRDDGIVYFGLWEDDHQSGMGLKVVPARFCHGESKKSFARRKFREIWKDKTLIYQKEIIEMPNVLILQQNNRLTDISIVVCQSDDDNCYQDPVALQRFLRSNSLNLMDFAKYFTISQNSDEENEPINRRKHYLEHDEHSPTDTKLTKYSHDDR